ncbi:hypothetical protein RA2_04066 [Roseovarius sp. A-2]|uniref:hypothetical protein n=1 Tax=Roseovarius sp. A-2 TaxID=1570360 RepID=UPI0009B55A24|nr:hypothetical protein [Roseovarius sp. A-2]GAW36991.1 hypothetical protein RA2_04066 [Roseovarius sp. A-2]
MIPIEARIDELESDLGRVAAWLEYRFPELGRIRIHSALQDPGVPYRKVAAVLVEANGEGLGLGLAVTEAKRCMGRYDWQIHWYSGASIAASVWSDATPLRPADWVKTLTWLEDGDPVFGPD